MSTKIPEFPEAINMNPEGGMRPPPPPPALIFFVPEPGKRADRLDSITTERRRKDGCQRVIFVS